MPSKSADADDGRLEERVAQRTRELAEANARLAIIDQVKTELLCLVSHELRTPLGGIFGTTEILLERFADQPDVAELGDMYVQPADERLAVHGPHRYGRRKS